MGIRKKINNALLALWAMKDRREAQRTYTQSIERNCFKDCLWMPVVFKRCTDNDILRTTTTAIVSMIIDNAK